MNFKSLAIKEGGIGSPWSTTGLTCSQTSWNCGGLADAAPLPLPPVAAGLENSLTLNGDNI